MTIADALQYARSEFGFEAPRPSRRRVVGSDVSRPSSVMGWQSAALRVNEDEREERKRCLARLPLFISCTQEEASIR